MKEIRKHSPRAQTTLGVSFGPFLIVLAFHIPPYHIVCRLQAKSAIKYRLASEIQRKEEKHTPRAQTMPLASFGPFLIAITSLPIM